MPFVPSVTQPVTDLPPDSTVSSSPLPSTVSELTPNIELPISPNFSNLQTDPVAISSSSAQTNTANLVSEELRTKVYNMLAENLLHELEKEDLDFTAEDAEKSAEFILSQLDTLQTKQELLAFLKQAADRWPIYKSVYDEFQREDLLAKVSAELKQTE